MQVHCEAAPSYLFAPRKGYGSTFRMALLYTTKSPVSRHGNISNA